MSRFGMAHSPRPSHMAAASAIRARLNISTRRWRVHEPFEGVRPLAHRPSAARQIRPQPRPLSYNSPPCSHLTLGYPPPLERCKFSGARLIPLNTSLVHLEDAPSSVRV